VINKVILLGRLGKDPEMKYTENGSAVTRISVATERRWKDDEGHTTKRLSGIRCRLELAG